MPISRPAACRPHAHVSSPLPRRGHLALHRRPRRRRRPHPPPPRYPPPGSTSPSVAGWPSSRGSGMSRGGHSLVAPGGQRSGGARGVAPAHTAVGAPEVEEEGPQRHRPTLPAHAVAAPAPPHRRPPRPCRRRRCYCCCCYYYYRHRYRCRSFRGPHPSRCSRRFPAAPLRCSRRHFQGQRRWHCCRRAVTAGAHEALVAGVHEEELHGRVAEAVAPNTPRHVAQAPALAPRQRMFGSSSSPPPPPPPSALTRGRAARAWEEEEVLVGEHEVPTVGGRGGHQQQPVPPHPVAPPPPPPCSTTATTTSSSSSSARHRRHERHGRRHGRRRCRRSEQVGGECRRGDHCRQSVGGDGSRGGAELEAH